MIDRSAADAVRAVSLAEILRDPDATKPPEAVVPRLAYRGRVTLLAAREKDGKSTLAGAAAACLSAGLPFLDGRAGPGTVLWVTLEEHVADYAARFVAHRAAPDRVFVLDRPRDPVGDLRRAVEELRPDLVVVDSLAEFCDAYVEEAGQSAQWIAPLAALRDLARDHDLAVVLIHHARRSDGRYRDSSAIGAGVDLILEMEPPLDDPTARKVRARGRFPADDFTVRLAPDGFALATGALSPDARALLYVEGHPGCSHQALRDHLGGRAQDADAAVRRLLEQHAIADRRVGNRHAYHAADGRTRPSRPLYRGGRVDEYPGTSAPSVPANSLRDGTGRVRDERSGRGRCHSSRVPHSSGVGTSDRDESDEALERVAIREEGAS